MFGKKMTVLVIAAAVVVLGGCSRQVNLSLKYMPETTAAYSVTTDTIKDFKFEQPSLTPPKIKEEQSGTSTTLVFDQAVENIDENGNATARITVKELSFLQKDKDAVKIDFDSTTDDDKSNALMKVIGTSYVINITPTGQVSVLDAKAPLAAVKGGYEGQVVRGLFSDEAIVARHEILALPNAEESELSEGDQWTRVVQSPKQLLVPKNYQKVYTLTDIENGDSPVATVKMTASQTTETPEGAESIQSSFGPFAKMFDSEDDYTGEMTLAVETGKVLNYEENLVVTYIAVDPTNADPEKGPDKLTMRFTQRKVMKAVD